MAARDYVHTSPIRFRCAAAMAVLALLAGCVSGPSANTGGDVVQIELMAQFKGFSTAEIISAGDAAFEQGEYERAEFIYNHVVTLEAEKPDTWLKLGKTLTYLGKPAFAAQAYEKVLQIDPDNAAAHEELGLLYIGARQAALARQYLNRAIELDDTRWAAHNALGVLADTERHYPTAIDHYQAALAHNPDSAMLLTNLGYSHYLTGDLDRAEDFYRTAIRSDSTYRRAVANLGLIYARRGDYDEAVVILRKVTERPQAYNDVGYLAYQNGDLDAASWLLSEAIRISPTYYETAYENLEKVRREFKRQGRAEDEVELIGARDQIKLRDDREPEYRRVDAVTLHVRRSASTDSTVVAYLRSDDSVEVLFDNGNWAFIGFGEGPTESRETGWVRSKYLVAEPVVAESR